MNCNEFVELVTAYLEGSLEPAAAQRFVAHLAECPGCDRYLEQIRQTIAELGQLTPEHLSAEARSSLLGAFREWRRDQIQP
jgi:anti-sigma factor RsiW